MAPHCWNKFFSATLLLSDLPRQVPSENQVVDKEEDVVQALGGDELYEISTFPNGKMKSPLHGGSSLPEMIAAIATSLFIGEAVPGVALHGGFISPVNETVQKFTKK